MYFLGGTDEGKIGNDRIKEGTFFDSLSRKQYMAHPASRTIHLFWGARLRLFGYRESRLHLKSPASSLNGRAEELTGLSER